MTLGELFEETYIQGEIAIRSYDSTGTEMNRMRLSHISARWKEVARSGHSS